MLTKKFAAVLVLAAALLAAYWVIQREIPRGESAAEFIDAGPFRIAVSTMPEQPRTGANRIRIEVRDEDNRPVAGAQVRAVAEMPAMGAMPAMRAPAEIRQTSRGVYEGELELSMEGAWPLAVDVATGDDRHVDLVFDMTTSRAGLRLTSAPAKSDNAYYTCSMHPSIKSAAPGSCPICGMDLEPVSREELYSGTIVVNEGRRQAIGVKTAAVERRPFTLSLRLQGKVAFDERRIKDVSLRFDGWIGELDADFAGKRVQRGDILFTVYSPELLSLQEEFLRARQRGGTLEQSARRRMKLWGLTERQIAWLAEQNKVQDYVPIFAPVSGTIIDKSIVAGSAYRSGQRLLRLVDLSRVWVEAFAYEQDLPLVRPGMTAQITLPNRHGEALAAEVMQVDPFLQGANRSARVRLTLPNSDGALQPGAFADVTLRSELGELLLVPQDAVLISGEKRIVFVDLGGGRLKPRQVRTGYSDGDHIAIRSGLSEGERIVTSGVFLIAAESRLKSGIDQW
ncbi:efflux RND transporter periplasmic adaptor subunit [Microbulbifer taiwanensis]|uniref:Efflux RND transporter periplasmic adaptor subunit n=1 Tax=Microbulbifer taiwanensis TaxID=986746 RepID=A0ABW1YNT2_9GAMM|nr:efflux RND transporter periplasmic adaptor subunit [Microbulbifer taiwanensis]